MIILLILKTGKEGVDICTPSPPIVPPSPLHTGCQNTENSMPSMRFLITFIAITTFCSR